MRIVIDIDDDIAHDIIEGNNDTPRNIVRSFQATIADAIKNGTPLPKGHGRLIDFDALDKDFSQCTCEGDCKFLTCPVYDAKTIIKADRRDKEDDEVK